MKIDPNLVKMKDFYINDIARGWVNRVMRDARDYLSYMNNGDLDKVNKEMDTFAQYLRDSKKDMDSQRRVK